MKKCGGKIEIEELREIIMAEFKYWYENDKEHGSICAIGALSNVIATFDSNWRAPWHPKKKVERK